MPPRSPTESPNKPAASQPGRRALSPLAGATLLALALAALSTALGAVGIYVLAGGGWALLFLSAAFAAPAVIITRGLIARGR